MESQPAHQVSRSMPQTAAITNPTGVETPSGKIAADENFPVGSVLLPARLRPVIAAFYGFARAADDIADNPALSARVKIERLDVMAASLDDAPGASRGGDLAARLKAQGLDTSYAHNLLVAFRQDAEKSRYQTFEELHFYCRHSADPVGRFLVDLHEGAGVDCSDLYPYSDGLCTALQIVNHLQDCGKDLMVMDRCYLPEAWLAEAGASVADLRGDALSPGLRQVIDRLLDDVDVQLVRAAKLPAALRSRRLAMESAIIIRLARRLAARLRVGDPLATRVKLTKMDFAVATVLGAVWGFFAAKGGVRT